MQETWLMWDFKEQVYHTRLRTSISHTAPNMLTSENILYTDAEECGTTVNQKVYQTLRYVSSH